MSSSSVKYLRVQPEEALPAIEDTQPFKLILVVDEAVPEMWQWEVCRALVHTACRYVMAWGSECESWREAVEDAHLEAFNYEDVPQAEQLIATAHEDEDLSEVFWFAKHRVRHPAHELRHALILHIGKEDRRIDLQSEYEQA